MNTLIDLTGKRFGKLIVREKLPPQRDGRTRWLCDCDCGNTCVAYSYTLRKRNQVSCGCGKIKDLTGARFGHLIVLNRSNRYVEIANRGKRYLWECRCDCGQTVYRLSEKLHNDIHCSCKDCTEKYLVDTMIENAGYIDGTQLSKLTRNSSNTNSASGVRGVFFNRRSGKWRATLKLQGKSHYLGEYVQMEDAIKARQLAEEQYFSPLLKKYASSDPDIK